MDVGVVADCGVQTSSEAGNSGHRYSHVIELMQTRLRLNLGLVLHINQVLLSKFWTYKLIYKSLTLRIFSRSRYANVPLEIKK